MRSLVLFAALSLLGAQTYAQTAFTGRVSGSVTQLDQGDPIAGVALQVAAPAPKAPDGSCVMVILDTGTDDKGHFELDLSPSCPPVKRLAISAVKAGYQIGYWRLDCDGDGSSCAHLRLEMALLEGEDKLDPEEKEQLLQLANTDPKLYLLPSPAQASGPVGGLDWPKFELTLRPALNNYLQSLPIAPPPKGITHPKKLELKPFTEILEDLGLDQASQARATRFGRVLKALGMLSVAPGPRRANRADSVQFSYTTIPALKEFQPIHTTISSAVSTKPLSQRQLVDTLSLHWSFHTLLALNANAAHALQTAIKEGNRDRVEKTRSDLERTRAYLVAERANLTQRANLEDPDLFKRHYLEKLFCLVEDLLAGACGLSELAQRAGAMPADPNHANWLAQQQAYQSISPNQ